MTGKQKVDFLQMLASADYESEEEWPELLSIATTLSSRSLDCQSLLHLRNAMVEKFPNNHKLHSHLEGKAITMLWNFGIYKDTKINTTAKSNVSDNRVQLLRNAPITQ